MDFIIDNYLWFVIGGIALLMIIIGYFAEKTDFGKKPLSEKKPKEKVKEEPVEEVEAVTEELTAPIEPQGINDMVGESLGEDLTVPLDEGLMEIPGVAEPKGDLPEINLPEEDLNVPFGDAEVKIEEPVVTDVPEIVEDEADSDEDDVWKF